MKAECRKFLSQRYSNSLERQQRCDSFLTFRKQHWSALLLMLCFLVGQYQAAASVSSLQSLASDTALQRGLNALKESRFEQALEDLTMAEKENPDDARIRNFRGITLVQLGKPSEAETEYREAIRLDPSIEDAWRNLGFLLWISRRPVEAREKILQAIALSPEDSFAHYYLGRLQLDAQEYADGFRELSASGVAWPDDPEFLIQAARGYVAIGQSEDARKILRQTSQQRLTGAEAAQVASLQIAIRDYQPAIELLKIEGNAAGPDDMAWARFDLALSYLLSGNYEQAVEQSRNYVELQRAAATSARETAAGWSLLGIAEARAGHFGKAVTALKEAAHLEPTNEEHWLNLTRALMEASRYRDAIAATQEGIVANPKSYALHLRLGAAQLAAGHYNEAEGVFRHLADAHDPMPISYVGLAQVLLREGRAEEAAAVVTTAEQQIGKSFLLSYFRGLSLDRAGRHKEAASAFREAIKVNADSSEAHLGLGKAELAAGETDDAIAELQEVLRLHPSDPQAGRLLSQAYQRKGDTKKAEEFADASSEKPAVAEGDLLEDFLLPKWQMPQKKSTGHG
jgi:Flp pilus assembly protein TadD